MTNEEFFEACRCHDWFYDFSDDPRVYRRGYAARQKIRSATDNAVKQKMYTAWYNYMFSGPAFKTERAPEPKLEHYV